MSASRFLFLPLLLLAACNQWLGQADAQPLRAAAADKQLQVAKVLKTTATEDTARPAGADLQVRVFWVVGGTRRDEPGKTLDEFKEASAELGRLGIDRPRLVAQLAVVTVPQVAFEMTGVALLETPCRVAVSGAIADGKEGGGMEIAITVTRPAAGKRADSVISRLRTQVSVSLDRPLVLGVCPADGQKAAFVLQVQRREAPGAAGKLAAFECRDAPWARVFESLTERTGLPVVSPFKPTGTFTFIPPHTSKGYSVPEIIDLLNEALTGQHYLLIRREQSITLVAADERVDPGLIPRVRPEDLELRGRTELVSMVMPLKTVSAEDLASEIKKMMGPFGEVQVLKKANRLVLQDTAGNLRRIYRTVLELNEGTNAK